MWIRRRSHLEIGDELCQLSGEISAVCPGTVFITPSYDCHSDSVVTTSSQLPGQSEKHSRPLSPSTFSNAVQVWNIVGLRARDRGIIVLARSIKCFWPSLGKGSTSLMNTWRCQPCRWENKHKWRMWRCGGGGEGLEVAGGYVGSFKALPHEELNHGPRRCCWQQKVQEVWKKVVVWWGKRFLDASQTRNQDAELAMVICLGGGQG